MTCKALCKRFPDERMCDVCRANTGTPFGTTWAQVDAKTQVSKASPHGNKGTFRQKHQNKTFKYMRVKPVRLGYNWQLLRLKQIAGEARWEEAEINRMLKEADAMLPAEGQRLTWDGEKYVKTWRK